MDTQAEGPKPGQVQLETPIRRGDQVIESLTLRKPQGGELRGLSLSALLNSDVDALIKVLPRIASPVITEADVIGMDPADLTACAGEVIDFLLQKGVKEAFRPT